MTEADRADLRELIRVRLAELEAEGLAADGLREDITLDQQSVGRLSRMDAIQRKAMAEATQARRGAEATRLRAALSRIDGPEFGICTDCGEDIPMARLRISPGLNRCAKCTRGV